MSGASALVPRERPLKLISIPGISNVALLASTTGDAVRFRWPRDMYLHAWILTARQGTQAAAGALSIRMQDENQDELVFDGLGFAAAGKFLPPLAGLGIQRGLVNLGGITAWTPRWLPMSRFVKGGSQWIFQAANGAGATRIPELSFRVGII